MSDKQIYLNKLWDISDKETFWTAGYFAQVMGLSVNCVYKLLNPDNDKPIAPSTMRKVKEFVDKYEREHEVD